MSFDERFEPWMHKEPIGVEELTRLIEGFRHEMGTVECTCETCDIQNKCTLAWDYYNTDGDCLLMK